MNKIIPFAFMLFLVGACRNDPRSDASQAKNVSSADANNDFVIVPGKRVGMITGETTEADVEAAYGKENVRFQSLSVAEGEQREGVLIFPASPNELEIIWELEADNGRPAFVRLGREGSDWKILGEITVGTTLEKLEEINGKPFTLYGFEWDFGGLVTNWNGGKMSPYAIIAFIPQNFDKLDSSLLGEIQLSSDDPRVRALNAKIGSIVITFE